MFHVCLNVPHAAVIAIAVRYRIRYNRCRSMDFSACSRLAGGASKLVLVHAWVDNHALSTTPIVSSNGARGVSYCIVCYGTIVCGLHAVMLYDMD